MNLEQLMESVLEKEANQRGYTLNPDEVDGVLNYWINKRHLTIAQVVNELIEEDAEEIIKL